MPPWFEMSVKLPVTNRFLQVTGAMASITPSRNDAAFPNANGLRRNDQVRRVASQRAATGASRSVFGRARHSNPSREPASARRARPDFDGSKKYTAASPSAVENVVSMTFSSSMDAGPYRHQSDVPNTAAERLKHAEAIRNSSQELRAARAS